MPRLSILKAVPRDLRAHSNPTARAASTTRWRDFDIHSVFAGSICAYANLRRLACVIERRVPRFMPSIMRFLRENELWLFLGGGALRANTSFERQAQNRATNLRSPLLHHNLS
jgi:hypothetical protein